MGNDNTHISVLYNNHCRRVAHQCLSEIAAVVGTSQTNPGLRYELAHYEEFLERYDVPRNDARMIEIIRERPALWAASDVATEIRQCIERYDDNVKNF